MRAKELPENWERARTRNWVCLVEQVPSCYQGTGKILKQGTEFTLLWKGQGTPGELGQETGFALLNKSQGTIKELEQGIEFTFMRKGKGTAK